MVEIRLLGDMDLALVVAAEHLFDGPTQAGAARRFLDSADHHLLLAFDDKGRPIGFVSGVEVTHPDKGTEMFLYEVAVDEPFRRQGIGRGLVNALADLAVKRGCYGMWVAVDDDNTAALATYRAAGAEEPSPVVVFNWSLSQRAARSPN